MIETSLLLIAGLVLLIVGGELLVRGAVRVATAVGVSPLVIGLTLVGFGTSTPELVTSVQAALMKSPGIAYGNIVGSNISNILLIVGAAALLSPMAITSVALKRDGVVMLVVALAFAAVAALAPLGRAAGVVFIALLLAYVYLAFRQETSAATSEHVAVYEKSVALQEADSALAPSSRPRGSLAVSTLIALTGLLLVVVGGRFLVDAAVALARGFGISETVIGLTIVAVGTSMPEFVTSVVASIRKQGDVAFGNIIGSNIYNLLGIGGFTALIAPGPVPAAIIRFDNLAMVGVSAALLLFAWTGLRISRREGALLLAGYAIYVYAIWP
ncbi:calcium/sodium antiporter [Pseudohaliea sp.]|uniref:calcium/sodium antiporter n=1 Tax=Pseudohaliea sp. TaxID=2740289 RepID=UPI0032EF5ADF